tara:strand:+ start:1949 stop:4387 length:2439 start_codon:yes stop_codon:yes gene_type:complete
MATRNLVPRNDGEGSVGRVGKAWDTGVFNAILLNGTRLKDELFPFSFFSDVYSNQGVTKKTYYDTPDSDIYLSGVVVESANNLNIEIIWDGPNDEYIGEAFINNQQIPYSNIEELGDSSRKFKGHLNNFNAEGLSNITGKVNGKTIILPINEVGPGPTPVNIEMDDISNAIPKIGNTVGQTHLKEGDKINYFIQFATGDVTEIEILNSGAAEAIPSTGYTLTESGGIYTATVPVTISNINDGIYGIAVKAKNTFGSIGETFLSNDITNVEQSYPNISIIEPLSYSGRNDGLRVGESTTFENTVLNWNPSSDLISYDSLSTISIDNPNTYEQNKTVNYASGLFSEENNVTITATKVSNGSITSKDLSVKIANGPLITGIELSGILSSTAPHLIGASEAKAGDVLMSKIYIDGKGLPAENISLSVVDEFLSDGFQTAYNSGYNYNTLSDGSFEFEVPVNVFGYIGFSSRDGDQPLSIIAKNNFNTLSDKFTSSSTFLLNNGDIPNISVTDVFYPSGQQAIKSGESVIINNSGSNFDSISYSSPNNEISISNSGIYETGKTATYLSGDYNIGAEKNLLITCTKSSNGVVIESENTVNIANQPLTLSINNLNDKLISSPSGIDYSFNLISSQVMNGIPLLNTDPNQTNRSILTQNTSGTATGSNSYTIKISDADTKGDFTWSGEARNLANISTNLISNNANYILSGFTERTLECSPNSLGAGLVNLGTTVANPQNIYFENLSEGGAGPNGGVVYSYENISGGMQLNNTFDHLKKFTTCDISGLASASGDHIFNLDKINRFSNTSTINPAIFIISEI